jgi:uncharacterized phiE125 gp8 family phage protein
MLTRLKKPDYAPVSLSLIKTHLRLNHTHEDEYLIHSIDVVGQILENHIGQSLLEQTWQYVWHNPIDGLPPISAMGEVATFPLPFPPVQDVLFIQAVFPGGKSKEIKRHRLIHQGSRALLTVTANHPILQIQYVAGMAKIPSDLPPPIIQALLHMVAHLYEYRQNPDIAENPMLSQLLTPYTNRGFH